MLAFRRGRGNSAGESHPHPVPPIAAERSGRWLLAHCLGFGACWGWIHSAFFSGALWSGCEESFVSIVWLVNVLANGGAMLTLGLLACRRPPLGAGGAFAKAIAGLMIVGTLSLSCSDALDGALTIAGAVLSGVGSAGLLLLWAEAYEGIAPGFAKKRTIPGSMVAGVGIFLFINALPRLAAVTAMLLLPVASTCLLSWCKTSSEADTDHASCDAQEAEQGTCAGTCIGGLKDVVSLPFSAKLIVYCLPLGFLRGNAIMFPLASSSDIGGGIFAGAAVILACVGAVSILLLKERNIDIAYRFIVPLMAAGLLLLPFLDASLSPLAGAAIMSGYVFLEMYVWAYLADQASVSSAPSAAIFGIGKVGMNIGLMAGTFLGIRFAGASSMLAIGVSVLIVYLFIVLESFAAQDSGAALAIRVSSADDTEMPSEQKMTAAKAAQMNLSASFEAILNEKCRIVSEKYGLSKRESEVLSFLARGQSLQATAELLGVAYSTIKTHTDRIYGKTGVHSRRELISLVEQAQ